MSRPTAWTPKAPGRSATSSTSWPPTGLTIFLSSHLLSEVEQVCTHVAVMALGKLQAQGHHRRAAGGGQHPVAGGDRRVATAPDVLGRLGLDARSPATDAVVLGRLGEQRPEDCCRALVEAGVGVRSLTTIRPSLEDTFVALTGKGLMLRAELVFLFRRLRIKVLLVVLALVPALLAVAVDASGGPHSGQRPDLSRPGDPQRRFRRPRRTDRHHPVFPAPDRGGGRRRHHRRGSQPGHAALPAGPPARADPTAGRQGGRRRRVLRVPPPWPSSSAD